MEFILTHMYPFFNWLLDTSAMASLLALVILIIRVPFKNIGVRWQNILWLLLIIRLLIPLTSQTSFSLYNVLPFHADLLNQVNFVQGREATGVASKSFNTYNIDNPAADTSIDRYPVVQSSGSDSDVANVNTRSPQPNLNLLEILLGVWLIGVLGFGGYIVVWQQRFLLSINKKVSKVDSKIRHLFEDCMQTMHITCSIEILQTPAVQSPTLFGLIHPRLLLPQQTIDVLSPEQIKHILLHELAHFKRKDILFNWISSVLMVIHWFNPVLWLAFDKMREDQEIACDAIALSHIAPQEYKDYGLTIIKLLETSLGSKGLPGMARLLGRNSGIKRRIEMLKVKNSKPFKGIVIGLFLVAVLGTVGLTNPQKVLQPAKQSNDVMISDVALKIAAMYKEPNPQILKVTTNEAEVTHQPLYLVFLTGNFHNGALIAPYLSYSVMDDGKKVYALRAYGKDNKDIWQESEVSFSGTETSSSNLINSNQTVQEQDTQLTHAPYNIEISKVEFHLGTVPNQKFAAVYISIVNPEGRDKSFLPRGTISAFIGASGKVYDILKQDQANHIDRSLDVTYKNTEKFRKDLAEKQGKTYEPGVLLYAPGVMVDANEGNIAAIIYENENGQKIKIPVEGITPTVVPINPNAK